MNAVGAQQSRAVLVCHRSTPAGLITAEWTYWDSIARARQADAELTPCGPLCIGIHSAVRLGLPPDPRCRPGYEPKQSRRRVRA